MRQAHTAKTSRPELNQRGARLVALPELNQRRARLVARTELNQRGARLVARPELNQRGAGLVAEPAETSGPTRAAERDQWPVPSCGARIVARPELNQRRPAQSETSGASYQTSRAPAGPRDKRAQEST